MTGMGSWAIFEWNTKPNLVIGWPQAERETVTGYCTLGSFALLH
jgi:hypothetical protein